MTTILTIIGIFTIVASFIIGILSGSGFGFFLALIGGITSSVIFFALSMILSNQEKILNQLQPPSTQLRKLIPQKTCTRCDKKHDGDMSSCPYCGFKPD